MSDPILPELDWRMVFNRADPPGRRQWGRVRAAQLRALGTPMVIVAWGVTLNALYVFYLLGDRVPPVYMALWLLALAGTGLLAARQKRRGRGREIHWVGRRTIDRVAAYSFILAFIWVLPAPYFFGSAAPGDQLALGIMTAVIMSGAAILFSPVPAASVAFIAATGVSITLMLHATSSPERLVVGPIYMLAMLGFAFSNGRAFMRHAWLRIVLEERQETISLLLREHENADADWLWRTNASLRFENVSARFARAVGRSSRRSHRLVAARPACGGDQNRPAGAARHRRHPRRPRKAGSLLGAAAAAPGGKRDQDARADGAAPLQRSGPVPGL